MNWYRILKTSQLWENTHSPYTSGFPQSVHKTAPQMKFMHNLYFLYELEYKYSMLLQRPEQFNGLPQRRENMLEKLRDQIKLVIAEVAKPISVAFDEWLEEHNYTKPGYTEPEHITIMYQGIIKQSKQLRIIDTFPINEAIIIINKAIGTVHQSGDMMEYIESERYPEDQDLAGMMWGNNELGYEITDLMTLLSGKEHEELKKWNEDLNQVGFQA
jgi:hypothetical protein